MPIPISPAATAGANAPRVIPHSRISTRIAKPINWPSKPSSTIDTLPVHEVVAVRTLTAFRRRHGILPQPAGKRLEELVALTREER